MTKKEECSWVHIKNHSAQNILLDPALLEEAFPRLWTMNTTNKVNNVDHPWGSRSALKSVVSCYDSAFLVLLRGHWENPVHHDIYFLSTPTRHIFSLRLLIKTVGRAWKSTSEAKNLVSNDVLHLETIFWGNEFTMTIEQKDGSLQKKTGNSGLYGQLHRLCSMTEARDAKKQERCLTYASWRQRYNNVKKK